jgi:hypothetical protein
MLDELADWPRCEPNSGPSSGWVAGRLLVFGDFRLEPCLGAAASRVVHYSIPAARRGLRSPWR